MRILGTICARGGSKGVKNKNIRILQGKPLIAYSIEALKKWNKAERIIFSTDSLQIQEIANKYGAETPFLRPPRLATDSASKIDVLKHLIKYCEKEDEKYDIIVDLDPTSPLRKVNDIDNAFNKFIASDADLLFSVYKAHKNPYFNMVELVDSNYATLCKKTEGIINSRQRAPAVYSLNASIYIMNWDFILNTTDFLSGKNIIYEMNDISIDIDREIDFQFVNFILKEGFFNFDY